MAKNKPPSFEKQKILDVRIGFRLKSIFWPLDRNTIIDILDKLGYKDIQESSGLAMSATKTNLNFYFDYSKMVFGFHSKTTDALITAQRDFFALSLKDFKTNLSNFVRFYEIENITNYFTDKNVHTVFSSLFGDSSHIKQIEGLMGTSVRPNGLEVVSKGTTSENDKWYSVIVEPKVESAGNAYFCRLIYRDKEMQAVYDILRKSSDLFEKLVSYVENIS